MRVVLLQLLALLACHLSICLSAWRRLIAGLLCYKLAEMKTLNQNFQDIQVKAHFLVGTSARHAFQPSFAAELRFTYILPSVYPPESINVCTV
jgi:hypothetical protein